MLKCTSPRQVKKEDLPQWTTNRDFGQAHRCGQGESFVMLHAICARREGPQSGRDAAALDSGSARGRAHARGSAAAPNHRDGLLTCLPIPLHAAGLDPLPSPQQRSGAPAGRRPADICPCQNGIATTLGPRRLGGLTLATGSRSGERCGLAWPPGARLSRRLESRFCVKRAPPSLAAATISYTARQPTTPGIM